MTTLETLEQLLLEQIKDLYDAEQRLVKALPKMAEKAESAELRAAFNAHFHETERHVERLESVFEELGIDPTTKTCAAMKGLLAEGDEAMKMNGNPDVRDAALIAAAQRVEHYEMASYGTARTFARRLGFVRAAELLQETLDEEGACDKKLTAIAESSVNEAAER